jgi:hypothetical protein
VKNFKLAYWYFLNGVAGAIIDIGEDARRFFSPRLRRRRRALEILTHAKMLMWNSRCGNAAQREAFDIVQVALMKVWAE